MAGPCPRDPRLNQLQSEGNPLGGGFLETIKVRQLQDKSDLGRDTGVTVGREEMGQRSRTRARVARCAIIGYLYRRDPITDLKWSPGQAIMSRYRPRPTLCAAWSHPLPSNLVGEHRRRVTHARRYVSRDPTWVCSASHRVCVHSPPPPSLCTVQQELISQLPSGRTFTAAVHDDTT